MTTHAVVLTSLRRAFPLGLLDTPSVDHVTIVAEAGHPHRFPRGGVRPGLPTVGVIEVESIRDTTQVLRAVRQVSALCPVDRILSPVEFGVATAGFLRSALGVSGESFDVGLAFSDKFLMKRRLAEAGLKTARFTRVFDPTGVREAGDSLGWPVIVKPTVGALCMDVARIDGPEAARAWATGPVGERLRADGMPVVVEEYVAMHREFHVDAVVREGEMLFATVSIYFDPLLGRIDDFNGSWIIPRNHPDHDEALALTTRAVKALGLRDGVTHVELFRSQDGFRVGEAACRPPGGGIVEAIHHQHGVDLWEGYWSAALGNEPVLDVVSTEGLVVNVNLPIRPGRIVELSTEAEIRTACPGLIDVRMNMNVGDVISSDLNSSSTTGVVFFRARDEAEIGTTLSSLRRAYRMEVEPAPAEPARGT
ncbi:ATP-grasp domain-containing protein [Micromonospora sp. NPDC050417]|uniref:ATP-grasp domain-containing protein n=1 Tax=Micromonospora sp. NPDC050417 TaxID=3364280 RepID=UPI0037BA5E56